MSANDDAWSAYLKAKAITLDGSSYFVDAAELKAITGREPRILAKFDVPEQLAKPLRDQAYTLLPVQNGVYLLTQGNLFAAVAPCENTIDFQPTPPFSLATAGRGSSESQYLDYAFNMGILTNFLNIGEMYLTIRGREYTKRFEFNLATTSIQVQSVQIEVDAGYEALYDIVLIEAKIGIPKYFNIRQMYYPYRHFSLIAPHKRVRNVLLTYNLPTAAYQLYEYGFHDSYNPQSIELKKCATYKIAPILRLNIYDLLDVRFQTRNRIVPQADDLNKVFELLNAVALGVDSADATADYFVFDVRQSSYYREAAEYLGLLQADYTLTDMGAHLLAASAIEQEQLLAKIVVNSWVFVDLIEVAQKHRFFTIEDIDAVIGSIGRYSGTTIPRRRRTIEAWLEWLAAEIGCFEITPDRKYLLR